MAENPITKEVLLNEEQMDGKINLYARVTVAPFGTLAYHAHHGETETYYILSGRGEYNDNGAKRPAAPGDVFFCRDGDSHGIVNTTAEPLSFMALIIRK
ncbi:MAG: cupin domain-containing protein [Oscillospiraceae bacterium]|nr:cupin domain-containing protein [Oscillospiraceae bacterium]